MDKRRNELENKVKGFIRENNLLDDVKHVCVATSGGADSMVLLSFFNKFSAELDVTVSAMHVNHGIRGESADRDENFVRDFCMRNEIEFTAYNATKDGIKVPENASEEWARNLRYNYINEEMKKWTNARTATAHTKSDQAETLIGNIYHGSGINGMSGIPVRRGCIIRPVLCLNRKEIEELAECYDLKYMTDETNNTDDYRRNKIRHHIIPAFKVLGGEAPEEYLSEACNKIAEAYDFIKECGDVAYRNMYNEAKQSMSLVELMQNHKALRVYIIGKLLGENNSKKLLEKLENEMTNAMMFADEEKEKQIGVVVISSEKKIIITNKEIYVRRNEESIKPVKLVKDRSYYKLTDCVTIYIDRVDPKDIGNRVKRQMVTTENKLKGVIAGRCYGKNEFKPMARKAQKIKHLIGETNICIVDRPNIPLIFDEQGSAIWMCDIGFTDDYVATDDEIKNGEGLIAIYLLGSK